MPERTKQERPEPGIVTVGHSNDDFDDFARLLLGARVTEVVDVRRLPGSSRYPQFDEDALATSLPARGIGYRRIEQLGGRRGRQREIEPRLNAMWRNRSFHNYADYAMTEPFEQGLDELIALAEAAAGAAAPGRVAVMCAEAVWWRCHRRIIADHLLARGLQVGHLMPGGRLVEATLTPGAVVRDWEDGGVVYPEPEPLPDLEPEPEESGA